MGRLWAIIAGKDDERVVFDARFLDRVQDLASAMVHLGEAIGPIAVAGFAGELRIGQCGHVHERERDVGKERFPSRRVSFDEINGAGRYFSLHVSPARHVEFCQPAGLSRPCVLRRWAQAKLRFAFQPCFAPTDGHRLFVSFEYGHIDSCIAARDAVPFVKALMRRESLFGAAEMPFAPHTRGVALCR